MERGNSKHSRHLDAQLDAEARRWTHAGPGAGRAELWRDVEAVADDDGFLTGIHWLERSAPEAEEGARPAGSPKPTNDRSKR